MTRRLLPLRPVARVAGCCIVLALGCAEQSYVTTRTSTSAAPLGPFRLACRLANYGPYQGVALSHLHSIGVRYVFMEVPAADQVAGARERLAANGLTALVLRGQVDFTQPAALGVLDGQLAVCEQMDVGYMFLSVKGHWPDKEVIYDRLRRAGDLALRRGVVLALETHPELGTNADVQRQTLRGVNHPNVRVNFDTGNITYYNQDRDAADELEKIIDHVATIELKDHDGKPESWDFPALGKGKVNLPRIASILKAHRYTGPVTIEIEGAKGVTWSREQTQEAVAESVRYLRSLGGF